MNGATRAVVRSVLNEGCEAYAILEGASFGGDQKTTQAVFCIARPST